MGLYLGIDASTQSMKCIVIDTVSYLIVAECSVNFGKDLPHYASPNGFLLHGNPLVKHADPLMWLEALELLFRRLQDTGVSVSTIQGISGSGQQHGTVYLMDEINMLHSSQSLAEQFRPKLARRSVPIWMDRSTAVECQELNTYFGTRIQCNTGSPATERFSGPQIRKFAKEYPEEYAKTARIHLVSSFLCSVLCGKDAPIDFGDGAGMNLLNLKTLQWDREITEFTAPGLLYKLPGTVPSSTFAGTLDVFFSKFGFTPGIPVVTWSGDNPNSLIGAGAGESGCAGISLGTSDTFFAPMADFKTDPAGYGHIFGNPSGGFMSLICFTNGSLAREEIRKERQVSWEFFDRTACRETAPGNGGRLVLPYFEPENTPLLLEPGIRRNYEQANPAEEIRAVLESQALLLRLHSEWLNEKFLRIRVIGGGSKSEGFRQILADVFQADIETISAVNSAALGAAIRAANVVEGIPFKYLYAHFCSAKEIVKPNHENKKLYDEMGECLKDFLENNR